MAQLRHPLYADVNVVRARASKGALAMKRTELFFFSMCVAALIAAPACSSSTDAASSEDAGSGDDEGGSSSSRDAGNHADSSTRDAGSNDAATNDSGTSSLEGWTAETSDQGVLLETSTGVSKVLADPTTPRRLVLRLQSGADEGMPLDITWNGGSFGQEMTSPGPSGAALVFARGGTSSFGADGNIYEVFDFPSAGRVPVELEQRSDSKLSWLTVSPQEYSWPPRDVLVMPGSPTRVFVQTDAELVEATAATPTSFPTGYFQSISLSPDRMTYLAVSQTDGLEKCTLTTGSCAPVSATGVASGDVPSRVWIDPVDASRVFLATTNAGALRFYVATDGGSAFTAVPLPSGAIYDTPQFSPATPSTIAVQMQATESSAGGVSVSTDSGAHWTDVPLPQTPITDISGFAFDAAGTLFLVRNGTLFSRSTF
jgi:hypothetical protein